jgi:hypothetical protein
MRILSEGKKPDDAFAAVHFHNHWYWIDDREMKRYFSTVGADGKEFYLIPDALIYGG